jgi:hypothetical protein
MYCSNATWHIDATATPDDFDDYAVEWHMLGAGAVRLKNIKIMQIHNSYYAREFNGGLAVLNPTPRTITIKLPSPMKRLSDSDAPRYYAEVDDSDKDFKATGAWEILSGEEHYSGDTYRLARKPGETASWTLTAPSTDMYTVYACTPGGKNMTSSAQYTVRGINRPPSVSIDQRKCDGGWFKLFDLQLTKGQRFDIVLHSSGSGATAADAVRIESKARFNDGALVKSIDLDPLDGTMLLNQK